MVETDKNNAGEEVKSTENVPGESGTVDGGNSVEVKESKNARRKRERREKLPNDPVFKTETPKQGNPAKPVDTFNVKKTVSLARQYAPAVKNIIDGWFTMRGAMCVTPVNVGAQVDQLSCDKYGDLTYYFDDNGLKIEGPIQEAFAFHCIVLSGGTVSMIEGFIKRHRGLTSMVAVCLLAGHMEYVIRSHEKLIEKIRQARATQETYTPGPVVDARENVDIEVKPVDSV